jgi:hypothetical protein
MSAGVSAVTGSLHRIYEGRIQGANLAGAMLKEHGVRSTREWMSLLRMSLQTYYQALNCSSDHELRDRAWLSWQDSARAWHSMLGSCARVLPRWMLDQVSRQWYALRRRKTATTA